MSAFQDLPHKYLIRVRKLDEGGYYWSADYNGQRINGGIIAQDYMAEAQARTTVRHHRRDHNIAYKDTHITEEFVT